LVDVISNRSRRQQIASLFNKIFSNRLCITHLKKKNLFLVLLRKNFITATWISINLTVYNMNIYIHCISCYECLRHIWTGGTTDTCFIQKIYAPSSSLLQGKHLPFTPSPLRLNIFRLFVILSLTKLYRYTPEIFLFSTATFKYKYRAPPQTNWKGIFSESRIFYFSVNETDTVTSGPF
jgi:hypothetical protein